MQHLCENELRLVFSPHLLSGPGDLVQWTNYPTVWQKTASCQSPWRGEIQTVNMSVIRQMSTFYLHTPEPWREEGNGEDSRSSCENITFVTSICGPTTPHGSLQRLWLWTWWSLLGSFRKVVRGPPPPLPGIPWPRWLTTALCSDLFPGDSSHHLTLQCPFTFPKPGALLSDAFFLPKLLCLTESQVSTTDLKTLLCVCVSCSVMSDSLRPPWPVAQQAPLSMRILQARILEWVAMPFSRGSFQPRGQTQGSYIAGRFFTVWATRKPSLNMLSSKMHSKLKTTFLESHLKKFCHSAEMCIQGWIWKHLFVETPERAQMPINKEMAYHFIGHPSWRPSCGW